MEKKNNLARLAWAGIMAGTLSLAACNEAGAPADSGKAQGIQAAKTQAAFESECAKLMGKLAAHDCKGHNECKGYSYQEGMAVGSHSCKGFANCKGVTCLEG